MIQSQFANESQKQQLPSEHSFDIYPSLYSIKHDYDQQLNKRTIIKLKEFQKIQFFQKCPDLAEFAPNSASFEPTMACQDSRGLSFFLSLRVEFLLKTESGYLRDAEVT